MNEKSELEAVFEFGATGTTGRLSRNADSVADG